MADTLQEDSTGALIEGDDGLLRETLSSTATVSFSGIDTTCWGPCLLANFDANDTFTLTQASGQCCSWLVFLGSFSCPGVLLTVEISLTRSGGQWTLKIEVSGVGGGETGGPVFLDSIADNGCPSTLNFTNTLHAGGSGGPCCAPVICLGRDGTATITFP